MAAKGLKKIKSTNKNTAPKGVKARIINPQLDQPTTPFWNPSDLPSGNEIADWLNQQRSQWNYYGGYQGPPTPMPGPSDMPAANIGAYSFSYNPTAPTTPASPTTPMLPGVGVVPSYPMYGPPVPGAQTYAPVNTGADGGGSYGNPDYSYWVDLAKNQEQWTPEEQAAYLAQFYGQTDEQGNLIGVGNPRFGDPYQVMPYWKYDQPTWIGGREGGASSMGRGRLPSRYYIPKQEFYKTPGGRTYASRDGWEDAFGKDEKPAGNNNMKTIPAWVGPLVSWRT